MQGGQAPKDWYGEAQYGFYDLLISKTSILITSINWRLGSVMLSICSSVEVPLGTIPEEWLRDHDPHGVPQGVNAYSKPG